MKTYIHYYPGFVYAKGTKAEYSFKASFELIIDQDASDKLRFGCVSAKVFVTRPSKRQIRRQQKEFRKEMKALELYEKEDL
ncbi:Hypothetical protein KNT65_gp030 [Escherichia phage EcS1]|uniref:Uncharacterized protein n=1 Tax=Escherichia phage EcS1 TaxID=2083276 RepID=A0A2Z5ZBW6_9CAUD|nr:Hypothetical protein KNT65_gp030 [Escherichia phage EcS1]BBC78078.1 Hypothetical protein [Escherichia phage EcS1]